MDNSVYNVVVALGLNEANKESIPSIIEKATNYDLVFKDKIEFKSGKTTICFLAYHKSPKLKLLKSDEIFKNATIGPRSYPAMAMDGNYSPELREIFECIKSL
jgi:hypothetical protein